MGKIKRFLEKKSIQTSFTIYTLACILSALLLALVFSNICQFGRAQIYQKYQAEAEKTRSKAVLESKQMEVIDENYGTISFYTEDITSYFTLYEKAVYNLFGFLSIACYPIFFIICISVTSISFYKKELQKPLEILDKAADNIADNNLDFEIISDKQDELGKLCLSFEKMRLALQDNNNEMWRQIEERRRLNTAFSHDLRTPLTVLKGQSEMLVKYAPKMSAEKIAATGEMMQRHIIRLENYVNTMNDLQRLEDIEVDKQPVNLNDLAKQICTTGKSICQNKRFIYSSAIGAIESMGLDFSVMMRVYENLIANAVRFTKENITVSVGVKGDCFYIAVSDDGKGFSAKDLTDAAKPFYRAEQQNDSEHFGMGLNICKILCEKHGGYLKLANNSGAVVTAVFKQ